MKRSSFVVFALLAVGLVVVIAGRRRMRERRELAFREELETLPSVSS